MAAGCEVLECRAQYTSSEVRRRGAQAGSEGGLGDVELEGALGWSDVGRGYTSMRKVKCG